MARGIIRFVAQRTILNDQRIVAIYAAVVDDRIDDERAIYIARERAKIERERVVGVVLALKHDGGADRHGTGWGLALHRDPSLTVATPQPAETNDLLTV